MTAIRLPSDVLAVIAARGSTTSRPLAEGFASQAAAIEGVELRGQQSRNEPWYFQVRHADHPYVVAYANVRQSDLAIDYRLPREFGAAGRAERRTDTHSLTYGLRLKVRYSGDLPESIRLLTEAIFVGRTGAQRPTATTYPDGRDLQEGLLLGHWGIRTDTENNTDYIWRELRQGRLRQGWGRRPLEDLELIEGQVRDGRPLDEGQQQTWRGNRRLLSTQPDAVQIGDLAVLPHVAGYGTWTIARITGPYRFSTDDGRNYLGAPDFGHILPVEIVTDPIPWRDPAHSETLRAAMRQRQRMWSLAPVADEVDDLARKFGR